MQRFGPRPLSPMMFAGLTPAASRYRPGIVTAVWEFALWIDHCFLVLLKVDSGIFQCLGVTSSAAVATFVCLLVYTCTHTSLKYILKTVTARP